MSIELYSRQNFSTFLTGKEKPVTVAESGAIINKLEESILKS
nr:MAG TPA: hypothetical protein [Caudoviricetes sp.]